MTNKKMNPFHTLLPHVIPAQAGIYWYRFLVKPGMTSGLRVRHGMTNRKRFATSSIDLSLLSGINYAYLILLFFLPLLMLIPASEVFEFPKMLFVYAMTVLIGTMWVMRMVVNRKILIAETPLDIPILLFLLVQAASTMYSIEPHTSWWGYYSRFNGGLWSIICYTILYYAFISNLSKNSECSDGRRFKRLKSRIPQSGFMILGVLFSAFIISLYAILQHFGIDKNFWIQDVMNRVFSTQGQPNWLAGYLVMILPLFFTAVTNNGGKMYKSYRRLYWGGLAVCSLALWWTKSRSGLAGLATAGIVFGSLMLPNKRKRLIGLIVVIGVIGVIFSIWRNRTPRDNTSNQGTESGEIRRIVWKGAGELIRRYPLFGTGPETFAYTYWWTRPVEHNYTSEWNFLYNKAHNEWLNLAANTGLLGLGSHLLLLGWFTAWSLSFLRRQRGRGIFVDYGSPDDDAMITASILAGIWGVEIVNFFGFSTVTIGAYTYLLMAIAINKVKSEKLCRQSRACSMKSVKVKSYPAEICKKLSLQEIGAIGGVGLIGLYFIAQIFIMLIADLGYHRGRQYLEGGYIAESIPTLSAVVELVPNEPVFRQELGRAQAQAALEKGGGEAAGGLAGQAVENFRIVRAQNPWHLTFLSRQSRAIFNLGVINPDYYSEGIRQGEQAQKLSPTDPRLPYSLGLMHQKLGEDPVAEAYFKKALELKSDYAEVLGKLEELRKKI